MEHIKDLNKKTIKEFRIDTAIPRPYPFIPVSQNATQFMTLVKCALDSSTPLGVIGSVGEGKTSLIEAIASALGRKLITLSLSTMSAEDFSGPMVDSAETTDDGSRLISGKYATPQWLIDVLNDDNCILYLDEYNTARVSVQHASMQVVQSRMIPGTNLRFSDKVGIILSMNPADMVNADDLIIPVQNRFAWVDYTMEKLDFVDGSLNMWSSDTAPEFDCRVGMVALDSDKRADYEAQARTRKAQLTRIISTFAISDKMPLLSKVPNDDDVAKLSDKFRDNSSRATALSMAFPTPRSLSNMVDMLSYVDIDEATRDTMLNRIVSSLIVANIGLDMGTRFTQYLFDEWEIAGEGNERTADVLTVLDNPEAVDWERMTMERVIPLLDNMQSLVDEGKEYERVVDTMLYMHEHGAGQFIDGARVYAVLDQLKTQYSAEDKGARHERCAQKVTQLLRAVSDIAITIPSSTAK